MGSKYWDLRANTYDEEITKHFGEANTLIIQKTKKYCNNQMEVLDVGCGTGIVTIPLCKSVMHIDSLDISPKMLEIAKKASKDKHCNNIRFFNLPIEEFESEKHYDMVTAFNILKHITELDQFFDNVYGFLNKGGYFISATDCIGESSIIDRAIQHLLIKCGRKPKINFFTSQQLSLLIRSKGFEIIEEENVHRSMVNYFIVAKKI